MVENNIKDNCIKSSIVKSQSIVYSQNSQMNVKLDKVVIHVPFADTATKEMPKSCSFSEQTRPRTHLWLDARCIQKYTDPSHKML